MSLPVPHTSLPTMSNQSIHVREVIPAAIYTCYGIDTKYAFITHMRNGNKKRTCVLHCVVSVQVSPHLFSSVGYQVLRIISTKICRSACSHLRSSNFHCVSSPSNPVHRSTVGSRLSVLRMRSRWVDLPDWSGCREPRGTVLLKQNG